MIQYTCIMKNLNAKSAVKNLKWHP